MIENSKIKPYLLSDTNWKNVLNTEYQLAVLPWRATEAHNYHLPYSTDNVQCVFIAEKAAEKAWLEVCKVIVLPCIPFGVQSAQLDVKFNINMKPSTQFLVLKDIVESLESQGIKKLAIMNGHGGNNFTQMIRELYPSTKVSIFTFDWYNCIDKKKYFEEAGDHAGELETSIMMHITPNLVLPLSEAGSGKYKKIKIDSLKEGWVWTQRGWLNEVTSDTGVGSPQKASSEKGKQCLNEIIDKVAKLFREISELDLANKYE